MEREEDQTPTQTGIVTPKDLNKNKVKYLGSFFMVFLISLNSYFQYSSYVFNQLNYSKMGMISVATFFISSAISTVYAPWFSRRFFQTYSKKFLVASAPHVLLILTGVLASTCSEEGGLLCNAFTLYVLVSFSSIACGLGNALLWVLQGAYITDCTSEYNKGEYFGLFFQISQICNVVSPILSSFFFKNYGTTGYFWLMSALTAGSTLMVFFIKQPELVETYAIVQMRKESEYDQRTGKDFVYYKALNKDLIQRDSQTNENVPIEEKVDLSKLKQFITEKYQIKFYIPLFFLNGFILGYYWSQMGFIAGAKLSELSSSERNEELGFVYLVMGIVQIIFGRSIGAGFDLLEQKIIFYKRLVICSFFSIGLVIVFYFLPFFYPFYLISLLFGLSEMFIKSFIGGVLSMKFSNNSYESFAVYRLISNIGSGVAMIISSMFTPEVPLVLMVSVMMNIFSCYKYTQDIKKHLDLSPDELLELQPLRH